MKKKAELIYKTKLILNSSLVREIVIWKVHKSTYYPDGIRYRLVLVDPVWKRILLLFDNHFPKGHHYHLNDGYEAPYLFRSVKKLIEDYLQLEVEQEKIYEDLKNKN